MRSTCGRPAPTLETRGKDLGQQLHARRGGDARSGHERRLAQRASAEQQRVPAATLQHSRDCRDGLVGVARRRRDAWQRCGHTALAPGHVGRQDQRRHLPGRTHGGCDGLGCVVAQGRRALRRAHPRRHVARDGLDVRLQLRVVLDVVGGMVADDVDDGHLALARVVQVGETVAEAAAEVQQGRSGPAGHARIAVGGAGGHALEQAQHGTHLGCAVERGDEVHLGGAGIAETDGDPAIDQRAHQRLSAIRHCLLPSDRGRAAGAGIVAERGRTSRLRRGDEVRPAWFAGSITYTRR